MYERSDKRRIYQLIDMYLAEKIDEIAFCTAFVPSYDIELDYDTLTDEEYQALSELARIASRFSEFEEDLKNYPNIYYTKEELKRKILETRVRLDSSIKNTQEKDAQEKQKYLETSDSSIEGHATELDKEWLFCPDCLDAWESNSLDAMVICPKCNHAFHNPRYNPKDLS